MASDWSSPGVGTHQGSLPASLVTVPAGDFVMGSDSGEVFVADGEGPARRVHVDEFRIDAHTVTNDQFAQFVEATGFVTEAERYGWSFVFADLVHPTARAHVLEGRVPSAGWWRGVRGALWSVPFGPGSDLEGLGDHPVVHVSFNDALAYCAWVGGRLPTEAEWEKAARGGLEHQRFPWGAELEPGGEHRMNVWQGEFPDHNTRADGWFATAPVNSYRPNGYGLYCTSGNVWEWTADWFSPSWHRPDRPQTRLNPRGPDTGADRVTKGGSYLCHASYCHRYRTSARTHTSPDSSLGHTGFRVAADMAG
ncbi:formylglycine-generating enzyme family protein [Aestuariimicrobium sp. T2.26MG-19.2B]|uniref:formylglycine-generating enzyme family protein n=1 Tax=Aestuariimicrobium sp. T2.26MG-19.2B TaxID=3040679 RepID=UPI00247740D2|nr:formylglycine-generating enzyme family protein [Aestuariimicrobium sp. T2.26MG-19.2B]CAI9407838.1 Formylglycine-generating enzyme [Aestuariimicrobium sp. T2.26MG-19.2B]